MINIVAHRGYWKNKSQQNSLYAYHRACKQGFHCELDIAQREDEILIYHPPYQQENENKSLSHFINERDKNRILFLDLKSPKLNLQRIERF